MAWTQDTSEILSARARSRRLAAATVALCSIVMIGLAARLARADEPALAPAPDFALKSSTGANLRLSEYRSEVVALAFVASWCGACRDGMPQLRRLQQELAADGLRVLVVDFDTRPEAAAEVAAAAAGAFPVLLDPAGETGRLYDIGRLPTLVLVDRGGQLRGQYRDGQLASQAELTRGLRALLAE